MSPPEILDCWPEKTDNWDKRNVHHWNELTNGESHTIDIEKELVSIKLESFRISCHREARKRNKKVRTRTDNGKLIIQFYER